jgi:hypothetical protein
MTSTLYPGAALRVRAARPAAPAGLGHHASHARLIDAAPGPCPPGRVDAIIVPTGRPAAYAREALSLAARLRCPVVALCSRNSRASAVVGEAERLGASVVAVDVRDSPAIPAFRTEAVLAQRRYLRLARHTDTSLKRNIGLAVARMLRWNRVLFLDDDIRLARPRDAAVAAGLLDRYHAVGLRNYGFPDNSVVCHAYRATGGPQESFIGGGALAVRVARTIGFFPNIYNEDWFFLLDDGALRPAAVTGIVIQNAYDPYADPERARSEEFGDCLAEGVYALLDDGGRVQDADERFWRRYLDVRRQFIDRLLADVRGRAGIEKGERARMLAALTAAKGRQAYIEPAMCVEYLRAWAADRATWLTYLERLPKRGSPVAALAQLGLDGMVPGSARPPRGHRDA